jgi:hypothetical protein
MYMIKLMQPSTGEADETFEVPPELEAELSASIAEADRGETIAADELIDRLRRIACWHASRALIAARCRSSTGPKLRSPTRLCDIPQGIDANTVQR